MLPEHLHQYKLVSATVPVGRLLCPSEQVMFEVLIPELQRWVLERAFGGGDVGAGVV